MENLKERISNIWAVIVSILAGFFTWCMLIYTNVRDRYRRRHCFNRPVHIHYSVIPPFIIFVIIIWAEKNNLFQAYPGIQSFVDMLLYVVDQFYQFAMEIVEKLISQFNIPGLWEKFRSWFWDSKIF